MPSLCSTGRVVARPTSVTELAQGLHLPSPLSLRALIEALGVRGDIELPFLFGTHNLPQWDPEHGANFADGVPDLGTFKATFGTAEILDELFDPIFGHPILTAAFYAFYVYFLKGTDNGGLATGFCTSLASLVADNFWTGRTDTHAISKESAHRFLTAVHGKLLSRESLTHFHAQGVEGNARVERSCREIEAALLRGCDRKRAPLLFFIRAGGVFSDDYFGRLGESHCVMPYRFKYPLGHPGPQLSFDGRATVSDLDRVELYVWDCNQPESANCKLVFSSRDGQIHFDYFPATAIAQFSSQDAITLGVMTNGDYLLADHDLPFGGPLGLDRFILDFLLSPADLQITDAEGRRTGNFDGQLRAEIPGSLPCYLLPGAYLLPEDTPLVRRITGTGAGQYSFSSISPSAGSVVLQGVATGPGQLDVLTANADRTQLRFTPAAQQTFNLTLGRQIGDQVRGVVVRGAGGGPAADVDIAAAPDLSAVRVGNREAARTLDVSAVVVDRKTKAQQRRPFAVVNVASNSELMFAVDNWTTLHANVQVSGLAQ
jgi:hypothetical protein